MPFNSDDSGLYAGGDMQQRPSWADDSYYHDIATGVWQKKPNQVTVTAPPPVANARAEFDADGNATGNWFGPGGQTFVAEKYITPEAQQYRQSQGLAPLTVGGNGYAVGKQEEGIDHEGAAKWMRPLVLGSLGAMAGAGALGAAGFGPLAGMGGTAASGAAPAGFSYGMTLPGLGAGGAGWGTAATGAGSFLSQISQYGKYLSPAMKLLGKTGILPGESGGQPGGGQPGRASPGGPGTQGDVAGKQGGIEDLLAAYYAAQQNKDYSGNMKQLYSDMVGRQKPFLDQLNASYQDPNSFYGSNQWKGLESVYQNSIDRKAASQGRLANPTDREVLLQNYGMKELENYRNGLRQNAATFDPARLAPMAQAGYQAERMANSPMIGAIGNIGAQPGGWQSWFKNQIGDYVVGGGGGNQPWGSPGSELPPWMLDPQDPNQWGNPGSELPAWMYPDQGGGFESDFPMSDGGSNFDPSWFEEYY